MSTLNLMAPPTLLFLVLSTGDFGAIPAEVREGASQNAEAGNQQSLVSYLLPRVCSLSLTFFP